jgi:hypothetical protein
MVKSFKADFRQGGQSILDDVYVRGKLNVSKEGIEIQDQTNPDKTVLITAKNGKLDIETGEEFPTDLNVNSITVGNSFMRSERVGLGTTTTSGVVAGVGTAVGTIIYNAETGNVQVYKQTNGWVNITHVGDDAPIGHTATGGTITNYLDGSKQYRLHQFTGSGTFTVSAIGNIENTVDYLVIGGGGGAGIDPPGTNGQQGGGGAGGYRSSTEGPGGPDPIAELSYTVSQTSYTVVVGAGGASFTPGGHSYFGPPDLPLAQGIRCEGGGRGGRTPNGVADSGGSGGGGGRAGAGGFGNFIAGPNGTTDPAPNQGHDGGGGVEPAGGGGGAGGAGTPGPTPIGGEGKRTEISGPSYSIGFPAPPTNSGTGWFAGGGSGGGGTILNPGGGGGMRNNPAGGNADANSGGGAGGKSGSSSGPLGGSGVVFIRYEVARNQP